MTLYRVGIYLQIHKFFKVVGSWNNRRNKFETDYG